MRVKPLMSPCESEITNSTEEMSRFDGLGVLNVTLLVAAAARSVSVASPLMAIRGTNTACRPVGKPLRSVVVNQVNAQ